MPNRWIKEAYCASSRINAASADARDLWVRLLVNVDDHGLFHGDAQLVASRCYPLQPNARKCEQLLSELVSVQLLVRYESGGKKYVAITQWYERPRSKPKFPLPPDGISERLQTTENSCEQLQASTTTTTTTTTSTAANEISFSAESGGWHGVDDQTVGRWRAAYPAVDVDSQLAAAASWLLANPSNRKSNYARFLNGWMSRSQDKAPARGGGVTQKTERRLQV